jgi:HSP20 family protein
MAQSLIPRLWSENKAKGDVFSSLHREVDRVFDEFTQGEHWPFPLAKPGNGKLFPRVNVSETQKEVEVTAELPGVEDKDVDVSLVDDMLTIKAEKKSETKKTEKDYFLAECSHGTFERTMRLPCEVLEKKVSAKLNNGVLTITLPKSPKAKAKKKKIRVKSQKS